MFLQHNCLNFFGKRSLAVGLIIHGSYVNLNRNILYFALNSNQFYKFYSSYFFGQSQTTAHVYCARYQINWFGHLIAGKKLNHMKSAASLSG